MSISPETRDITALKRMVKYCDEILQTLKEIDFSFEKIEENFVYKNSLAMDVLQIGELTTHLTQQFKEAHPDIPWTNIKQMRNVAAHRYGEFNLLILKKTITTDIQPLKTFCENSIIELKQKEISPDCSQP